MFVNFSGGIGLIKNYKDMITMGFKKNDNIVLVIGKTEGHLDQGVFSRDILGLDSNIDLTKKKKISILLIIKE